MSGDGRALFVVAGRADSSAIAGDLLRFDLERGTRQRVTGFGTAFRALATDWTGRVVATGAPSGVIRVGVAAGRTPYELIGHRGEVMALAISPDGRWIASAAGTEIRIWPMPDLSKTPLHALPHKELMASLRAMTNLRAVPDQESATGYRLERGPFPGWEHVPRW